MKLCTKIRSIVTGYDTFLRIASRSLAVLASFDLQTGSNFYTGNIKLSFPDHRAKTIIHIYSGPSGPYDERLPALRSQGGLSWGCKMYQKYYLVWTGGSHKTSRSLTKGSLLAGTTV